MNYYFTITRMAMIKKTDDNTGEDVGKLEPSCTESINWYGGFENGLSVPQKAKHKIKYDLAISS